MKKLLAKLFRRNATSQPAPLPQPSVHEQAIEDLAPGFNVGDVVVRRCDNAMWRVLRKDLTIWANGTRQYTWHLELTAEFQNRRDAIDAYLQFREPPIRIWPPEGEQ